MESIIKETTLEINNIICNTLDKLHDNLNSLNNISIDEINELKNHDMIRSIRSFRIINTFVKNTTTFR